MSSPKDKELCKNTRVEIFMVLKDIHAAYLLSKAGELKASPNINSQQIIVFWKPPGASQWVEIYKTEVLPGHSNFQFVAGLIIDFEQQDVASFNLKFEIRQLIISKKYRCPTLSDKVLDEWSLWSKVETTLEEILKTGATGLDLPLTLEFGVPATGWSLAKHVQKCCPGTLLLRGEILHPCDFGVFLQFGIQSEKCPEYFIELHKLNQANVFEVSHPYTLVYRSEINDILHLFPNKKRNYFPESRLSNGDLDRVLRVVIFTKEKFERKGFALTTLRSILKDHSQLLHVQRALHPQKERKDMVLILNLFEKVPVYPLEFFFHQGWKIVPVFAVDYSKSNWCEEVHQRSLHDASNSPRTPYEDALAYCAGGMSLLSVAIDHAVFIGFGSANKYMNAYRPSSQPITSALRYYQDSLCLALLSTLRLSHEPSPTDTSSHSSSSSNSFVLQRGSQLSPLLNDLVNLITRRKNACEYYTVFILTDGQFTDSERYMLILRELSILPVSLIFIAVGFGDIQLLVELGYAHKTQIDGRFLNRKFVHLIHYRSKNHWNTTIALEKYVSSPCDIFAKDVLTTVREDALEFFKKYFEEFV